jgi:hypothetical protein
MTVSRNDVPAAVRDSGRTVVRATLEHLAEEERLAVRRLERTLARRDERLD